jgi:hypothetical protein
MTTKDKLNAAAQAVRDAKAALALAALNCTKAKAAVQEAEMEYTRLSYEYVVGGGRWK